MCVCNIYIYKYIYIFKYNYIYKYIYIYKHIYIYIHIYLFVGTAGPGVSWEKSGCDCDSG